MAFWNSIESVVTILIIMALGYFISAKGIFEKDFGSSISWLVTRVALPASVFINVIKFFTKQKLIALSGDLIWPIIAIAITYVIAFFCSKMLRTRQGRVGIFRTSFANANTLFIGLPINIALFGMKSLPYLLVYYIVNTLSLWTFGAYMIARDGLGKDMHTHKTSAKTIISKLLPPPILGFIVAIIFIFVGIPVPNFANSTLNYVGGLVTPLSLIFIGITLFKAGLKSIHFDKDTIGVILGRFVISPLVLALVVLPVPMPSVLRQTLIVQSATPTPTVTPILAKDATADVEFATNTVTTTSILFIIVVPIIMQLINYI
ncbi:AEC family transporter [Sporolactobacillus pectinivorans]|uniref:AEC family transporter n=1 Tax=Sporolactobacillus pectinivorans TaxID=1591408 RepID=UPI000C261FE6|nr:AEC family transporter [Sporolactobacillus pectinivorans]